MKLYQIPFSHNCVKVRRALEWKGLAYELIDIKPMDRSGVIQATGQWRVPALVVGSRMESEELFDGWFGDEDEDEGNPDRAYEIV